MSMANTAKALAKGLLIGKSSDENVLYLDMEHEYSKNKNILVLGKTGEGRAFTHKTIHGSVSKDEIIENKDS